VSRFTTSFSGVPPTATSAAWSGPKVLKKPLTSSSVIACTECGTHLSGYGEDYKAGTVVRELAIADLASLEKRLDKTRRSARTGDKEAQAELPVLEKAYGFLKDGRGLWEARLSDAEKATLAPLTLLTVKPVLYAANVSDAELSGDEGPHLKALRDAVKKSGEQADVVPFSAKIEAELAELPPEDRADFLSSLGLESAGLDRLIRAGYHLLGLETYFTAGEQEVRAWTIHRGDTAPKAAAVIHTVAVPAEILDPADPVGKAGRVVLRPLVLADIQRVARFKGTMSLFPHAVHHFAALCCGDAS